MADAPVRWWRSLRLRFAVALALVAAMTALVLGTVVANANAVAGRERLRSQATDALAVSVTAYQFNQIVLGGAGVDALGVPTGLDRTATSDRIATLFTGSSMWAAERVGDHLVTVQISASQFRAERRSMARLLGACVVGAVVFGAAAGWLISGSLTARLRRAAALVDRERRTGELAVLGRDGDDEVAELAGRIDELAGGLRASVERERAFSSDVAHELRTPLTALVSAVELLGDDSGAQLVRRQTRRLRDLVEDLLSLFRTESGAHPPLPVDTDVAALLRRIVEEHPRLEPDLVDVTDACRARVDPRHLERIVINLLANAHRHGAAPVTLTARDASIVVSDSGPGFPEELLRAGPQRFATFGRSSGSGLGLSIAQTLASVGAMTLVLANRPEGGAMATLTVEDPADR